MAELYDQDDAFWKSYMQHRPFPPQWLWDRMWDYHAGHSSDFKIAHDGGAGPGVHSPMLGKKFSKVIVSDPNTSNIEVAKKYLKNDSDKTEYEFHVAKFEELSIKPDASVDLVFLANAIHWTEQTKSHSRAANQLKSGGTYAIGLWYDVYFPKYPKIQELCDQIFDEARNQLDPGPGDPNKWQAWQGTIKVIYTLGASVVLPDDFPSESIMRIVVNREQGTSDHHDQIAKVDLGFNPSQSYRTEHVKDEEWALHTDFAGLMDRYATFRWDANTPEMQKLIVPLKSEFEKEGGTIHGLWQASLLLATRR